MGEAFITRRGGGVPYAVIGVTYPSGSTCTCTSGTLTLTAKDTSGKALFVIPYAGTWTVKAVKGSQSASKAVSITADGQVATVTLVYELLLYDSGNQYTNVTGGWELKSNGTQTYGTIGTDHVEIRPIYPDCVLFITKNKIDLSNVKTLKGLLQGIEVTSNTYTYGYFGICNTNTPFSDGWGTASSDWVAKTNLSLNNAYTQYTLDVSSISGSYYVCVHCVAASSYKGSAANVKQIIGV